MWLLAMGNVDTLNYNAASFWCTFSGVGTVNLSLHGDAFLHRKTIPCPMAWLMLKCIYLEVLRIT